MTSLQVRLAAIALIFLVAAGAAHALTVPKAGLNDLVAEAPVVLVATVVGQHFRTYGEEGLPYTVYSLRVQDVVYGEEQLAEARKKARARTRQGEVPLAVFGGLDKKARITRVVGTTELTMAQTYLLFLRGGTWSLNPIAGWNQGAFRLVSAGPELGRLVLSMDGKALMGVKDDELIFQVPDFTRRAPAPQERADDRDSGVRLDSAMPPKSRERAEQDTMSAAEEREAQRRRQSMSEKRDITREDPEKSSRRVQVKAWLGGQPMPLESFAELIRTRRAGLDERIPKQKRSLSLNPEPPGGRGMKPPEPRSAAN